MQAAFWPKAGSGKGALARPELGACSGLNMDIQNTNAKDTNPLMKQLKMEINHWLHSKRRIINMIVGISAVLLYETARAYYRPFIYSSAINDFHIADTLGNSLGTVATVFVFTSLFGRQSAQDYFLIRTVTISVLLYEAAHPLLGKPIDAWDMVATMSAGLFCEVFYRLLHRSPQSIPSLNTTTPK